MELLLELRKTLKIHNRFGGKIFSSGLRRNGYENIDDITVLSLDITTDNFKHHIVLIDIQRVIFIYY